MASLDVIPPVGAPAKLPGNCNNSVAVSQKPNEAFREYKSHDKGSTVAEFYRANRTQQSYDVVGSMQEQYYKFNTGKYTLMELFEISDNILDESDPDLGLSQLHHAIQTAERARELHPAAEMDWFWLTAFIHDLGKVLVKYGVPQWAVVGDTFPVGCRFEDSNEYAEFFSANPDVLAGRYGNDSGDASTNAAATPCEYAQGCGFDKLRFSFGHDDYFASALEHNGCTVGSGGRLPEEAAYIIRFHSFYPWHAHGGYSQFASDKDRAFLPHLKAFQKCDLYSKDESASEPAWSELEAFYRDLTDKYIGLDTVLRM
jgi:inositol oxygenase